MTKTTAAVLELNGNKYDLQKLLVAAKSYPLVDLGNLKLNTDPRHPNHKEHIVTIHNGPAPEAKEMFIFKQHDGYTVLHGEQFIGQATKARLVSSPSLKKVRFEQSQPATPERVQASSATGAMAEKMQSAYGGNKIQNSTAFGSHQRRDGVDLSAAKNSHGLNEQRFGRNGSPSGYQPMTNHQRTK